MTDTANQTSPVSAEVVHPHRFLNVTVRNHTISHLAESAAETDRFSRAVLGRFLGKPFENVNPVDAVQINTLRQAEQLAKSDIPFLETVLVERNEDQSIGSWESTVRVFRSETAGMSVFDEIESTSDRIFLPVTPLNALLNLFAVFNVDGEIAFETLAPGEDDVVEVLYSTDDHSKPL